MTTTPLDKLTLLALVEACCLHAPECMRELAYEVARAIAVECPTASTQDDSSTALRHTVAQFKFMISPEHFDRLERTQIHVVPAPLCNAITHPVTQAIVIFDGLLEALAFRLETSLLIAAVRRLLARRSEEETMSKEDFKRSAARAVLLPIHFKRNGKPLPRFIDRLSPDLQRDALVGFAGMLLFILFHELGHLVLNHATLPSGPNLGPLPVLACSETMNAFKLNEFEADRYAYDAVVPEARPAFIVSVWLALKMFSEFEFMSGSDLAMHPFTINRINRLNELAGVLDDPLIGAHAKKTFDSDFGLMQARISQRDPREAAIPATLLRRVSEHALYRVIDDENQCREAVGKLLEVYQAAQ